MSRDGWLLLGVDADLPGNVADDPEDAGPLDELEDLQIEIELSGTFTAELLERRDNLIRSLLRDGTSVRSVATAAGLSEVRVRQIRREEPSE